MHKTDSQAKDLIVHLSKSKVKRQISIYSPRIPKPVLNPDSSSGSKTGEHRTSKGWSDISRKKVIDAAIYIENTAKHWAANSSKNKNYKGRFTTLTLNPEARKLDEVTIKEKLNSFFTLWRRYGGKNVMYVWTAERHKDGTLHFHIVHLSYIPKKAFTYWIKNLGYVTAVKIKRSVSRYLSKYISKDLSEITGKRFGMSQKVGQAIELRTVYKVHIRTQCFDDQEFFKQSNFFEVWAWNNLYSTGHACAIRTYYNDFEAFNSFYKECLFRLGTEKIFFLERPTYPAENRLQVSDKSFSALRFSPQLQLNFYKKKK